MKGQMSLFEGTFIKDADCTKDTPVVKGKPDVPIYGQGIGIRPAEGKDRGLAPRYRRRASMQAYGLEMHPQLRPIIRRGGRSAAPVIMEGKRIFRGAV